MKQNAGFAVIEAIVGVLVVALLGIGTYYLIIRNELDEDVPVRHFSEDQQTFSSRENANGPYYHQIYSASSSDGLTWASNNTLLFDHASVPGAVIKDDTLLVYFVDASEAQDQLSVGVSTDWGETFAKHQVQISGVNPYDAVDPHPELVGGKIRLYYLGDFMTMPKGEPQTFRIYSAESEDGITFTSVREAYSEKTITTDPDVFPTDSGWVMIVNQESKLTLTTSSDGGITFTKRDADLWNRGGVSDTVSLNGIDHTFFCGNGIQSATGAVSGNFVLDPGIRLSPEMADPPPIVCDPSIVRLPDGNYLMFYKQQASH